MNKEEIDACIWLTNILTKSPKENNYIKTLLNLIDKLQKENEELKKQLKVNNTFNTKESEIRTPRYIESTTLKRWWLE